MSTKILGIEVSTSAMNVAEKGTAKIGESRSRPSARKRASRCALSFHSGARLSGQKASASVMASTTGGRHVLVREEQGIRRTKGEDIEDEADENEEHAPKVEAWALFDCCSRARLLRCCAVSSAAA